MFLCFRNPQQTNDIHNNNHPVHGLHCYSCIGYCLKTTRPLQPTNQQLATHHRHTLQNRLHTKNHLQNPRLLHQLNPRLPFRSCPFRHSAFNRSKRSAFMFEDLTRPCDACGKPIDGGYHRCKKCNIYFCFYCTLCLIKAGRFPLRCPMCQGDFE